MFRSWECANRINDRQPVFIREAVHGLLVKQCMVCSVCRRYWCFNGDAPLVLPSWLSAWTADWTWLESLTLAVWSRVTDAMLWWLFCRDCARGGGGAEVATWPLSDRARRWRAAALCGRRHARARHPVVPQRRQVRHFVRVSFFSRYTPSSTCVYGIFTRNHTTIPALWFRLCVSEVNTKKTFVRNLPLDIITCFVFFEHTYFSGT